MDWDSKAGPHSCTFSIDWLKEHDYTTPGLHRERREKEEPLVAVRLIDVCHFYAIYFFAEIAPIFRLQTSYVIYRRLLPVSQMLVYIVCLFQSIVCVADG